MTVINHKSISGITSITAPAGSDNLLTVHTNDTTERFRIVDSGAIVTGVTTASNFKTGTSNLHNVGVEVAGINVLGADTPIGTGATIYDAGGAVFTGVVTATSFKGSITDATGYTTINNNADNRVITGSGSANTLNGEANLTFDGSQLFVTRNLSTAANDSVTGSEFRSGMLYFRSRGDSAGISGTTYANQLISSNGSNVPLEIYTQGSATNTPIVFGVNVVEKFRIHSTGVNVKGDIDLDNGGSAGVNFKRNGTLKSDIEIGSSSDQLAIRARGSSGFISLHTNTSTAERLRIESDGTINIGKGDESSAVENLVELYVGGANGSHATIRGKYNRTNEFNRSEVRFGVEDNSGGKGFLAFATGNNSASERLRITSDGRVGIKFQGNYTMNSASTNLVIGDGGSGVGMTFWTAAGADNQTISFQTNETLNRAEGEIKYGPTNTTTAADRNNMMFRVNSSERLRIDSSGRVLIGDTANRLVWGINPALQVTGTEWDDTCIAIQNFGNNTRRPTLLFTKGKSGTIGNFGTAPAAGEGLGIIGWAAHDTTDAENLAAYIQCISTSQATANNQYGALTFSTTNGTSTTEKLRIHAAGGLQLSNTAGGSLFEYGGSTVQSTAAINIYRLGNGYADIRLSSNYGASLRLAGASNNTDEYLISQDNQKNAYHNLEYDGFINFNTNNTTQAMRLQSGKVGIAKNLETLTGNGVNAKLQVNSGSNDYDGIMIGGGYNRSTIATGATYDLILSSNAYPANATSKGIRFKCGTSGGGGPHEKMRIHSDGMLEYKNHGNSKTYCFSSGQSGGYTTCTIDIDAHAYHSFVIDVSFGGYAGKWGTARYMGYENGSIYYPNEGTEATDANARNITHSSISGHKHRIYIEGGIGTHPVVQLQITIGGPDAYIDTGDISYTWA